MARVRDVGVVVLFLCIGFIVSVGVVQSVVPVETEHDAAEFLSILAPFDPLLTPSLVIATIALAVAAYAQLTLSQRAFLTSHTPILRVTFRQDAGPPLRPPLFPDATILELLAKRPASAQSADRSDSHVVAEVVARGAHSAAVARDVCIDFELELPAGGEVLRRRIHVDFAEPDEEPKEYPLVHAFPQAEGSWVRIRQVTFADAFGSRWEKGWIGPRAFHVQ